MLHLFWCRQSLTDLSWSHTRCAGENDLEPLISLPLLPKHTATLKLFRAGDGAQGFLHVEQSHIGSSQASALWEASSSSGHLVSCHLVLFMTILFSPCPAVWILHCHGLCSPLIPSAEGLDPNASISTLFEDKVFIILLVSLGLFCFVSMSILPTYMYV